MNKKVNVSDNLKRLSEIAQWFDDQQFVDVEEGLTKVKEAAGLIKESKKRLSDIQNEFTEIRKQLDGDSTDDSVVMSESVTTTVVVNDTTDEDTGGIPF